MRHGERSLVSARTTGNYSGAGKASDLLRALDVIFEQPVVSGPFLARALGLTPVGTNHLVERLIRLEILWEQTGFRRNRRYRIRAIPPVVF